MQIHCKYDDTVPLHKLVPHPRNRNQHPKEQIERLAKILEYQGWRYPVKVSKRSGYVTSGHGRISAAKHMGWEQVPVNYQDYESEEQEYADVTADNAIASWSELSLKDINVDIGELGPFDIDLLGLKDFTVDVSEKEHGCDEDDVPDANSVAAIIGRGDLLQLGNHRLLCGDATSATDVSRLMGGEKADMVFTSPPYLDLRDYNGELDLSIGTLGKIFDWPSARYCINLGLILRERTIVQYWNEWIEEAAKRQLPMLSWNVWDKGHASAPAHQQAMFGLCHEWIFCFGKYKELIRTIPNKCAGETHAGNATVRERDGSLTNKSRTKIQEFRQLDSVLRLPAINCRSAEYSGHPASFPVAFAEAYVSSVDGLICEPFSGSGSTLIACEKTNRRCFGMEIDPHYCDVIVARWEKFTGQKAEKING